jgi:hypothetical protein
MKQTIYHFGLKHSLLTLVQLRSNHTVLWHMAGLAVQHAALVLCALWCQEKKLLRHVGPPAAVVMVPYAEP